MTIKLKLPDSIPGSLSDLDILFHMMICLLLQVSEWADRQAQTEVYINASQKFQNYVIGFKWGNVEVA